MTPTPTERIVLFPEPLHNGHRGRRFLVFLCLCGSLGSLGWFFFRDPIVRRIAPDESPVAVVDSSKPSKPAPAASQARTVRQVATTESVVDSGVNAYEGSAFDTAALLLRRALRVKGADSLAGGQRVRALTFLGAAELQRGKSDSATTAFRQLLTLNPGRPPDPAVFQTNVLEFYHRLRSQQQGVARIASTAEGVALTIVALKPHQLSVGVGQNGRPTSFQLFRGVVSDSVVVKWNGLNPAGAELKPGTYELVLVAFPANGGASRSVRFPVLLERESATGQLHARAPGAPAQADSSRGDAGQFFP